MCHISKRYFFAISHIACCIGVRSPLKFTAAKYGLYEKMLQIKAELNYYKKLSGRTCLSPPEVELGGPKIVIFEIFLYTEMGKENHFTAQCCQKYGLYEKMLQITVVEN